MMQSLFTTLLLAGSALSLPADRAAAKPKTCSTTSTSLQSWKVIDFDYHASYTFSTPAHQIAGGYVNFTIGNEALLYKPVCSGASTRLEDFFYGDLMYQCDHFPQGDNATFTFDRPSGGLQMNQTWFCEENAERFYGQGHAKLNLTCAEKSWKNPDWKEGELYSTRTVTCKHQTIPVPIESISATL